MPAEDHIETAQCFFEQRKPFTHDPAPRSRYNPLRDIGICALFLSSLSNDHPLGKRRQIMSSNLWSVCGPLHRGRDSTALSKHGQPCPIVFPTTILQGTACATIKGRNDELREVLCGTHLVRFSQGCLTAKPILLSNAANETPRKKQPPNVSDNGEWGVVRVSCWISPLGI